MQEMENFMQEAIREARKAANEVPVGAVIVKDGKIIARAHNQRETHGPLAHAEMLAMERAFQTLGERRLHGCTLYVTLEPCPMCAGGIIMAELDGCIFGAYDEKQGCCGSVYTLPEDAAFYHRVRCTGGVMEDECAAMLKAFFEERR
ncbi:MAG: nucleoside deaminase [Clostridia bacterium]|nr:nucleoside deaminase [Clostridia bacterium]